MGGAILRVGSPVHQQDGPGLQLGGAAGVARCHQRDAVIAPVIGQLLAVSSKMMVLDKPACTALTGSP